MGDPSGEADKRARRLRGPCPGRPEVSAPWYRLKRWHYLSVCDETHLLALGLVHLGFAGQLFCYVVRRRDGSRLATERLLPLGLGLTLAEGPAAGHSRFRGRTGRAEIAAADDGWAVTLDLRLRGDDDARGALRGALHVPYGDGVSVYFDHDRRRRAYTYKVADVPVTGTVSLDDAPLFAQGGRGIADFTRAYAERHTRWRWAAAAGIDAGGARLGLNLSSHVYDLAGASQENTLWVDGRPQQVGPVALDPPPPGERMWRARSADGATDLRFEPDGTRRDRQHLGVVRSAFTQASGRFEGRLCGRALRGMYGVMEDHEALW